jgi:hypothetical protein
MEPDLVPSTAASPIAHATAEPRADRLDALSTAALGGPLAVVLCLVCVLQYIAWVPNYLTWPWWADHDVFATAAHGWDAGDFPYRDLLGNNFPGTTYVFWLLGKLFGWSCTPAFLAFDACLVGSLGILTAIWSRRRLGGILPGLVGYALFLGYYLGLDYAQTAQRDWHGPFFLIAAILVAQAWSGHAAQAIAGALGAIAIGIRPQVVLLLPALAVSLYADARHRAHSAKKGFLAIGAAAVVSGVSLTLLFLPLMRSGIIGDFVRCLQLARYGSGYNTVSARSLLEQTLFEFLPLKVAAIPVAVALFWSGASRPTRRIARPWLLAFAGVCLYRPLSPRPHAYLTHPLILVWSVLAACLVKMVVDNGRLSASIKLVTIMLIVGLGANLKPTFCNPNGSREAITTLWRGEDPGPAPTGYSADRDVPAAAKYPWDDYRALIAYLRDELPPGVRVANALEHVPAITGPTGRLSAFPAESVAWIMIVHPEDEGQFVAQLRSIPASVVVWSPAERDGFRLKKLPRLIAAIDELYVPDRRFGAIEVWRRKTP